MFKIEQNKVSLISGVSLLILVLTNSFIKSDFWIICIDGVPPHRHQAKKCKYP